MPTEKEIPYDHGHFFVTFTCFKWIQLIELTEAYDLVYNWFNILTQQGHYITAFVIMPNHVHVTIAFRKTTKRINKIIGDGKRFIGYEIINRLKEKDNHSLLEILENAVKPTDKKRGKLYEVWEDSFNWKECNNSVFSWQKINYMHNNPFSGKWKLSENAIEYEHSSARFYITGEQSAYPILNFNDLNDINLLGH